VYRDTRDGIEVVKKVETGNISKDESEALQIGSTEAERFIDNLLG
jgi:hypothetical protein